MLLIIGILVPFVHIVSFFSRNSFYIQIDNCSHFLASLAQGRRQLLCAGRKQRAVINNNTDAGCARKEEQMKELTNGRIIIGIDHGYGNIKTANFCFRSGILSYDSEPTFTKDMLVYKDRYYLFGEGHKEFSAEKTKDDEYYVLTLAAIAKELENAGITEADVVIAAGLPLTWMSGQKEAFRKYLMRNEEVAFVYNRVDYRIRVEDARIYPQGYAAIADIAPTMKGLNLIADIGNGTMNTLYIVDGRPQSSKMYTDKYGTYQCTLEIREQFQQKTSRELNDHIIDEVLRSGNADIAASDLKIIKATASEYVAGIFKRLREHGYDECTMKLCITGGGGCLVRNFAKINPERVVTIDDICAAAKGYEYMAEIQLRKQAVNG